MKKIKTVDSIIDEHKKTNIVAFFLFVAPQIYGGFAMLQYSLKVSIVIWLVVASFMALYLVIYKKSLDLYKKIKAAEDSSL